MLAGTCPRKQCCCVGSWFTARHRLENADCMIIMQATVVSLGRVKFKPGVCMSVMQCEFHGLSSREAKAADMSHRGESVNDPSTPKDQQQSGGQSSQRQAQTRYGQHRVLHSTSVARCDLTCMHRGAPRCTFPAVSKSRHGQCRHAQVRRPVGSVFVLHPAPAPPRRFVHIQIHLIHHSTILQSVNRHHGHVRHQVHVVPRTGQPAVLRLDPPRAVDSVGLVHRRRRRRRRGAPRSKTHPAPVLLAAKRRAAARQGIRTIHPGLWYHHARQVGPTSHVRSEVAESLVATRYTRCGALTA